MADKAPATADSSPEPSEAVMTSAPVEARQLVELIAGPLRLGDNVKGALARVARATGLPDRRVRGIWHSEARAIRSEEMDRLRQAARDLRAREQARDDYRSTTALFTACDEALRLPNQDVDRPEHPGLCPHARGADRPLDRTAGRTLTVPAAGRPRT